VFILRHQTVRNLLRSLLLSSFLFVPSLFAQSHIQVSFSASGDDGHYGLADHYVICFSESLITSSNWQSSFVYRVTLATVPKSYPTLKVVALSDARLVLGKLYCLSVFVYDEAGNRSGLSNLIWRYPQDVISSPILKLDSPHTNEAGWK
jgi:hypothetical protein